MPCFVPTVSSQAACGGAVTGCYAREFDMDRESGTWSASGSAFGSETGSGSETHSASTGCAHAHGHSQMTRNQRQHAKRRRRSHPTSSFSREEVDVSSPSDYLCDTTSAPPSASASISAFAFPSRMSTERQREYRHEYGLAISAPARPFSWFYGPAPMLVKERGRAISSLLYLDLALSRSFRNTPPNHNHHLKLNNHDRNRNQPNTVLQAHIHLLPVLQTGGYSNGYRYLCPCWVWGRC